MSAHEQRLGNRITAVAPTGGVTAGDLIILKSGATGWVGEAVTTATVGNSYTVQVGHEIKVAKNVTTGEIFAVGDKVYLDASSGKATVTASGNTYMGRATSAAATADVTTVWVKLAPTGG